MIRSHWKLCRAVVRPFRSWACESSGEARDLLLAHCSFQNYLAISDRYVKIVGKCLLVATDARSCRLPQKSPHLSPSQTDLIDGATEDIHLRQEGAEEFDQVGQVQLCARLVRGLFFHWASAARRAVTDDRGSNRLSCRDYETTHDWHVECTATSDTIIYNIVAPKR